MGAAHGLKKFMRRGIASLMDHGAWRTHASRCLRQNASEHGLTRDGPLDLTSVLLLETGNWFPSMLLDWPGLGAYCWCVRGTTRLDFCRRMALRTLATLGPPIRKAAGLESSCWRGEWPLHWTLDGLLARGRGVAAADPGRRAAGGRGRSDRPASRCWSNAREATRMDSLSQRTPNSVPVPGPAHGPAWRLSWSQCCGLGAGTVFDWDAFGRATST